MDALAKAVKDYIEDLHKDCPDEYCTAKELKQALRKYEETNEDERLS